jgi:hypothetical protein
MCPMKPGNRQFAKIEMVPIHTKLQGFGRWEKGLYLLMPFCPCGKAFLFFKKESFRYNNQNLYQGMKSR